nr:MAG TPA: Formamidopyrimidine-DNA glycosylase/DNA Complex-DNA COMPLEX, GLYCOSYLASE, HYDANTOIN LESION [Caudoviricetes sp.]
MLTDANLTGEAREAYMEAIAKKSVNLTEDERMAFADALMRESAQATEAKQNRVYSQRGDDYLIEAQRLCAEDKPKPPVMCPYCGHKMVHQYVYGDHFFCCPKCRAVASDNTEKPAYTAAMQRWQGLDRVLTLEEVKEQRAIWLEKVDFYPVPAIFYSYRYPHHSVFGGKFEGRDDFDDNNLYDNEDYGVEWRCWLRKPTQEEMEGTPWETK